MSAISSFYLIDKDKFEEFCAMASLVPKNKARIPTGVVQARIVTREEQNSAEHRKIASHYESLRNFLGKNAREPFKFHWSGYVMDELIDYLKQAKDIDLTEETMVEKKWKNVGLVHSYQNSEGKIF